MAVNPGEVLQGRVLFVHSKLELDSNDVARFGTVASRKACLAGTCLCAHEARPTPLVLLDEVMYFFNVVCTVDVKEASATGHTSKVSTSSCEKDEHPAATNLQKINGQVLQARGMLKLPRQLAMHCVQTWQLLRRPNRLPSSS